MSVHNYYYFDYPADMREPSEVWMFQVTPQSIYMTDPYVIWEDDWKEHLIGPEACLWTKLVPRWRIMQKIIPRIAAFAETAWSRKENKNWQSFSYRSDQLRAEGVVIPVVGVTNGDIVHVSIQNEGATAAGTFADTNNIGAVFVV